MMKAFLAAAFLAAISIPASAGGRHGNLQISDQASGGSRANFPHNQGGIFDRWGNLYARGGRDTGSPGTRTMRSQPTVRSAFPSDTMGSAKIRDASTLPRKHNYIGTVTLVR